jgi:hypothetical protein
MTPSSAVLFVISERGEKQWGLVEWIFNVRVTPAHVSLLKASHVASPNFKGVENYNSVAFQEQKHWLSWL